MKKRDQLEQLQVLLCDTYKESIEEMKETGEYNAALLNGARQLLKDNDIVSLTERGTPLGELSDILPFSADDETKQAAQQS
jgi:hypothetical protein